jgi:hypothetical protein
MATATDGAGGAHTAVAVATPPSPSSDDPRRISSSSNVATSSSNCVPRVTFGPMMYPSGSRGRICWTIPAGHIP